MTAQPNSILIERWNPVPASLNADLDGLAGLLHACVHAGGSVSFVLPFSPDEAKDFWRDDVLPGVNARTRCVLLARWNGKIVGTVQLDLGTPPNQPHRAEVRKLLVHPDARRRGVARALMAALEEQARAAGRTLLTLDTVTGGTGESLYLSMGYVAIGSLPGYALNFDSSKLEATTIMYKQLSSKAS
jgi:GNAT superfamily N-acetyltransferase